MNILLFLKVNCGNGDNYMENVFEILKFVVWEIK